MGSSDALYSSVCFFAAVEWHQDLAYFPHTNDSLVTALIYLDMPAWRTAVSRLFPGFITPTLIIMMKPEGSPV